MYVWRTLDKTVTIVVLDEEGEGEWEMIPAPSLFADPSIPRHSKRPAVHQLRNKSKTYLAYQLAVKVMSFYEML
jgi:hypothetical protein